MLEILQTVIIIIVGIIVVVGYYPNIFKLSRRQRAAIMDSSALIDGRVIELARAGFVSYNLVVPEFILAELQLLADGTDSYKRERARFGLEVVQQLQREPSVLVKINRTAVQAKTTDEKLVKLAKKIGADLFTTDFNLNKVASIEGVRVLNVNELSQALRPVALPGEAFEVKIVQSGSNRDQGVGYLEDGTMIVVDGAKKDIGRSVKVNITRTHQTLAGKMLFATKVTSDRQQPSKILPKAQGPRTSHVNKSHPRRATSTPKRTVANAREASLLSAIDEMANRQ